MSDVMTHITSGIAFQNGAVVVGAFKTGEYSRQDPPVNHYDASGVWITKLDTRFDEYYGGGPTA